MKKTTIVGLGLILVLALVATVALAWGPGFGRSFGGPAYGAPSILNLTNRYPSFAIFSDFHTHFVQKMAEALLDRLLSEKGNLTDEEE